MPDKKLTLSEDGPRIEDFLDAMLDLGGFDLDFEVSEGETLHPDFENPDLVVRFTGEDVDLLLANKTELLLALEQLTMEALRMAPEEHDRALAVTSHLPHMAAVALANTIPENYFRLAGTGLLDTARLASGDTNLWKQILMQNRENVLTSLEQYHAQLQTLHTAIRNGDEAALERFLTTAKKNRDALGS